MNQAGALPVAVSAACTLPAGSHPWPPLTASAAFPPQAPGRAAAAFTCQEVLIPGLGPAPWGTAEGHVMLG